jgi:hypothetical protein
MESHVSMVSGSKPSASVGSKRMMFPSSSRGRVQSFSPT